MSRFDDNVMRRIRELYWPRVDEEGSLIPFDSPKKGYNVSTLQPDAVYDPDVVWVGSFADAMIHFGIFADRHLFKAFMFEVNDKGPAGGWDFTLERCLNIGETAWPHLDAVYPPTNQMLVLHSLSGAPGDSADPGELMTSPKSGTATGALFPSATIKEYEELLIAVDPQYNLHCLRRGDRIRKTYKETDGQKRGVLREVFSLRPLAEGSSHIPGMKGEQPIVV